MILRKVKRDDPFARVPKQLLNDSTLTWKAKGMLVYLLSKPDDWTVRATDIVRQSADGASAIQTGLMELRKAGYAQLRKHVSKGKVLRWELVVADTREFTQTADPSVLEIPEVENPVLENRSLTKKELTKKEVTEKEPRTAKYPDSVRVTVQRFKDEYAAHYGLPYAAGPADLKHVAALFAAGATQDDIIGTATKAWQSGGFWARQVTTLRRLADRWNEVRAELAQAGKKPQQPRAAGWAREMTEVSHG